MRRIASIIAAAAALWLVPQQAFAQTPGQGLGVDMDAIQSARILPGWRMEDGTHMAALAIRLAPGWKTYWRAPGDIGIPPRFDWRGSGNVAGVEVEWPTPVTIDQGGMTAIGYHGAIVLPLHVLPRAGGRAIALNGTVDLGVCRDVCIPMTLKVQADLPTGEGPRDGRIVAALANRPLSADRAGVIRVACTIGPAKKGGLALRAEVTLPHMGGAETMVIEPSNPSIWVARPRIARQGDTLIAETRLVHVEGRAFALDRSDLRLTVLGTDRAADIRGCPAG